MSVYPGTMLNPDNGSVRAIKRQIKSHNGYCPLKREKTPQTKCPCLEYREHGLCECGLYVKDIHALIEQMFA